MATAVKKKRPLLFLMAICIFNFLFHVFGFSFYLVSLCHVAGISCDNSDISESIVNKNVFYDYIITIKIQIFLWVGASLFLIGRRAVRWLQLMPSIEVEDFRMTLKCSFFPLISSFYVFSTDFLSQWTVERPPWFLAGCLGLLMMGSLTMLWVCIFEPNTLNDKQPRP